MSSQYGPFPLFKTMDILRVEPLERAALKLMIREPSGELQTARVVALSDEAFLKLQEQIRQRREAPR